MKVLFRYVVFLLGLSLSVLCYVIAQTSFNRRPYQEIVVAVYPAETPFISVDTVNKLLIQKMKSSTATLKDGIALNEVENQLKSHNMVANAELYTTISGKLMAEIFQRKPIAKVVGQKLFYIDSDAKKMPLSPSYTASVPIIRGEPNERDFERLRDAIEVLQTHPIYGDDVVGLVQISDSWYELILESQPLEIELGDLRRLHAKMNNYAAFMIKAQKDNLLERYRKISLAFDGQVVCTKI
ncbi:MAG: hypothetical protein RLZZ242_1370 [Bacteroidota bacterium]|jgi:cell division protein FtsQ